MKCNDCLDCGHSMTKHGIKDGGRCLHSVYNRYLCPCGGYTRNPLTADSQHRMREVRRY